MPKRIQRSRAKGWRMPEGAVVVDRSTPWGNPFVTGKDGKAWECVRYYRILLTGMTVWGGPASIETQETARKHVINNIGSLRGKDLACWCRLDQPCHADVLLELANGPRCEEVQS